jgi:hypothetical protein
MANRPETPMPLPRMQRVAGRFGFWEDVKVV